MIPDKKPNVAIIGTGGTIASVGRHNLELTEYVDNKMLYDVHQLLEKFPEVHQLASIHPVPYGALVSPAIGPKHWLELHGTIQQLVSEKPELDGIVMTHGTSTLEETAYFLNLTLKIEIPLVIVGAQRPASALSTDAGINLINSIRVAGSPEARGMGVLVVLNDEIQAAREVSKTSTFRLQTFRSSDFGVLGHADSDCVVFYRRPIRKHMPDTVFDVSGLENLPRVDIVYGYAGADGTAVEAFVAAGAKGIVVAGLAPGFNTPQQLEAMINAQQQGVIIVQSSRAGSGRVIPSKSMHVPKGVTADNLNAQKARVLSMLALTVTTDTRQIQQWFDEY